MLKTMDQYKPGQKQTGGFNPSGNHVGPGLQMTPRGGHGVHISQRGNPYQYTPQQTNAAYNQNVAQAFSQGDARAAGKRYQRGGLSSSKGTAAAGAADAAQAFTGNMAAAEAGRMQDAYANANTQLASDAMRNEFGQALAGLQEQAAQMQYMNQMRNMQNATGFMGNVFGTMTKPFANMGGSGGLEQILGGLL